MYLYLSLSGPLKPEITIAYVAVSLIFFNSGLSLKTEVGNPSALLTAAPYLPCNHAEDRAA